MRFINKLQCIVVLITLLLSSTSIYSQNCNIINDNLYLCEGGTYGFYTEMPGESYTWSLDNVTIPGQPYSYASITLPNSGNHTITVSVGSGLQQGFPTNGDCTYASIQITVNATTALPGIVATPPGLCNSGNTTLTLESTLPAGQQSGLIWTSTAQPAHTGTGISLTANGLTQSTTFTLSNPSGCYTPSTITVPVYKTLLNPVTSNVVVKEYRQTEITTVAVGNHYWQMGTSLSDVNGTPSTELPQSYSSPVFTATQDGFYYVRSFIPYLNCWTAPSSVVQVTVSKTPPLADIGEIKRYGYNELNLINDNADVLHTLATYYVTGTPDKPFTNGRIAVFEEGLITIKGKDNATGTWGNSITYQNILRSDDDLNWIHTKTYDGTSETNPVSESKSFFDQRGQSLQSQSKSFHEGQPVVFASLSLKDKYDRTVGGTLSAPILQSDFKYNSGLAITSEGKPLSYTDFEKPSPTPLATDQKGTLGNYYSIDNKWNETKVPTALRLYSRTDFYEDGTGEERRAAQPGDTHFIGSGREVLKGTFPVGNNDTNNELSDYLDKRAIALGVPDLPKIEGVQNVVRDENERYVVSISDKSGKVLMTARKGSPIATNYDFPSSITSDKMAYFYVLGSVGSTSQTVTITGTSDYVLENTITNTPVTKLTTALPHVYTLNAGFYRVLPATGTVTVAYTHSFTDIAYQFYNDAGRLVVSVSPNGYEQWRRSTPIPFSDIDKSTHTYNHQGWLLSMTEKDAGTTNYSYRKDGKIRFSQNAQQKDDEVNNRIGKGRFSYTNYDDLGRPIESGEYIGTTLTYASLDPNAAQTEYALTDKKDWVRTNYDYAASPAPVDGYTQGYVRGAVSWTENANTKTWYSYDEMGRVVWMAQKPTITNFPYTFVTNYEYDFVGNVLKTYTRARTGGTTPTWQDAFYHHYEYDQNKRLQKVYTSKDGIKTTLQAEYIYYLHGPLKRVVLASNLQGIDFVYNIHGWLTQINHPDTNKDPGADGTNGIRKDVFGLILEYYERSIVPQAALFDPKQYHHLPKMEGDTQQLLTTQADPFSMYRKQLHTNIEQLKLWSSDQKNFMQSGGGN